MTRYNNRKLWSTMSLFSLKSVRRKARNTKCIQLLKGKTPCNIKDTLIAISNYEEEKITKKFLQHLITKRKSQNHKITLYEINNEGRRTSNDCSFSELLFLQLRNGSRLCFRWWLPSGPRWEVRWGLP